MDPTVEVHAANHEWVTSATRQAGIWLATSQIVEFTAATLTDHLASVDHPTPATPAALGAVMRELGRKGWVENTQRYVASPNPRQRGRPIAVWRVRRQPTARELGF